MSAPNETASEDLRNALTLLYALEDGHGEDFRLKVHVAAARKRILSALHKIEHAESSAAAT